WVAHRAIAFPRGTIQPLKPCMICTPVSHLMRPLACSWPICCACRHVRSCRDNLPVASHSTSSTHNGHLCTRGGVSATLRTTPLSSCSDTPLLMVCLSL